jgi:regulation of enolase protein 1 (concanavalin A-like superfamily)
MQKRSSIFLSVIALSILVIACSISCAAANPGYIDSFVNPNLLNFWTFVNPAGTSTYSLSANVGWLRITAPTGVALAPTSNYNAPRVLQNVTGNFVATTCVNGSFTETGDRAGILLWKDNNNYMRLEKWGTNQVLMYGVLGGVVTSQSGSLPSSYNPLYLKLEKTGTTIAGYWSQTGVDGSWNLIKQFTYTAVDPVQVGLFAINVGTVPFSADFDYFNIAPGNIFVLPEYPIGTLAIPVAMIGAFVISKRRSKNKA